MTSVVSICNLALMHLGKDRIDTLDEASAQARACKRVYDPTLNALLQVEPWGFAGKTVSLGEITNDKADVWQRAYKRPVECLKVRAIGPTTSSVHPNCIEPQGGFPYELEGTTIYCDLSPAYLRFTDRTTDPTKFSPLFVMALSWHIAAMIAVPMTKNVKVRQDAYQQALALQTQAAVADANESRDTSDHVSEFVEVRG